MFNFRNLAWFLTLISLNLFANEINLKVNQENILDLKDDVVEVIIEDQNIVNVEQTRSKSELSLKGVAKGKTELDIHLRNGQRLTYQVFVGVSNVSLKSALAKIGRMSGVKLNEDKGKYRLTGNVTRYQDGVELKKILRSHPKIFIDKTRKTYKRSSLVTNVANGVLANNGFGHYKAKKYGKLIYLEGMKKNKLDHAKALRIAKMLIPNIRDGVANSPGKAGPAVSIDVMVLSYSNKNELEVGLKTNESSNSLATFKVPEIKKDNSTSESFQWTLGPFSHVLKLVESISNTKILANPRIVVRNGERATFHTGSEIFLQTSSVSGSGEVIKSYTQVPTGLQLEVLPFVDRVGQIDVSIMVEDSSFGAVSSSVSEATAEKSTSKSQTKVTLQNGYSILLSGFERKSRVKSVDKVPFLGDIPLVGELFKSRSFDDVNQNLMILMTVKLAQEPQEQTRLFSDVKEARIIPGEFSKLEEDSTEGVEFSFWD